MGIVVDEDESGDGDIMSYHFFDYVMSATSRLVPRIAIRSRSLRNSLLLCKINRHNSVYLIFKHVFTLFTAYVKKRYTGLVAKGSMVSSKFMTVKS